MLKLHLLNNGSLKILLTEQELSNFGLTFDNLDYANPSTRTALHTLLIAAKQKTGFNGGDHLLIEALPVDGGCLLLITPETSKRHVRTRRAAGPYVYEFTSADALLSLARSLSQVDTILPDSSLYRLGETYRLIVYPSSYTVFFSPTMSPLATMLSEYAAPAGEGETIAAYTAEHGQALAVGDALTRLGSAG